VILLLNRFCSMAVSYNSLQVAGVLGIVLLLFCSPLLALFAVTVIITLIFIDCDITTKLLELGGEKPESLAGQVVWITGASYGIGEFLAYELARCGCRIILSARTQPLLESVAEKCRKMNAPSVFVLPMDVTKLNELEGKVASVMEQFGHIDILVNNAGRSIRSLFLET
jgi:dehydrogenase/reductase SDR family protein 7